MIILGGLAIDSFGNRLLAALGSDTPPGPPAVSARGDPLALQHAELTDDDLPLDAEGRSRTGRQIPGLLPRRSMPADIRANYAAQGRAAIAAAPVDGGGPVPLPPVPAADNAPGATTLAFPTGH